MSCVYGEVALALKASSATRSPPEVGLVDAALSRLEWLL